MVFPRNDYALAKYLIDADRVESTELRRVMCIGALLESCNFSMFWRLLRGDFRPSELPDFKNASEVQKIIEPIVGFEDAVRMCTFLIYLYFYGFYPIYAFILDACQVIHVTFQRIDKSQLSRLLGGISGNYLFVQLFCALKSENC